MGINKAIEILKYHQRWRMGEVHSMHHSPATLSEALRVVIELAKNHKEEIIQAYNAGREYGCNDYETAEDYYNGLTTEY